ncbi:uncharacterized protein LOC122456604 [Dermochelys coriacea]|uniref:uncharacterized protein LOC122456604 n=1 Tax=Dermochelys coriacea TaxID=27794 RepID=UPI001CA93782|nr:uncharacterized protein LOC122456604 [Dermochelys coriacea]
MRVFKLWNSFRGSLWNHQHWRWGHCLFLFFKPSRGVISPSMSSTDCRFLMWCVLRVPRTLNHLFTPLPQHKGDMLLLKWVSVLCHPRPSSAPHKLPRALPVITLPCRLTLVATSSSSSSDMSLCSVQPLSTGHSEIPSMCPQRYATTGEVYRLPLDMVRGTPGGGSPCATGEEHGAHHHHSESQNHAGENAEGCHLLLVCGKPEAEAGPGQGVRGDMQVGCQQPLPPRDSLIPFADWRFIHRAQLNCVPLNGAVCDGNRDKRCRKYSYANKTLPHILHSCKSHSRAWHLRHNTIQDCLVRAIPPPVGKVAINSAIPGTDSQL